MQSINYTVSDLPLFIKTELTVANQMEKNYRLHDIYNPSSKHKAKVNITYMGYWDKNKGLKIILNDFKYERRSNLYGMELNCSFIVSNHIVSVIMNYIIIFSFFLSNYRH